MTQTKIIIGIGVLIGLLLFNKTKPNFLKGILTGLSICCLLGYFAEFPIGTASFMLIGVFAFIFSVWCGLNKKWLGLLIGIFTFVSFLFNILGYPYANEIRIAMLIPILAYLLTFRKPLKYKNEISILTILVAYELSEFTRIVELWVN